jgi:hypothetical protein
MVNLAPRIPVGPRTPRPQPPIPPNQELRPQLPDNYHELNPQDQQEVLKINRREQQAWRNLWLAFAAEEERYKTQLRIWQAENGGQQN